MKTFFLLLLTTATSFQLFAQLKLGNAKSEINFREGPGVNFKVAYKIDNSNLLVVLPREPQNSFIEVFDVETNSYGYVSENLISITDTLYFQEQHFFERSGENATSEIEIEMVNKTSKSLFIWINKNTYSLSPFEKKVLVIDTEDIIFFSSSPGLFPVFGKEVLKKGNSYRWNFSL